MTDLVQGKSEPPAGSIPGTLSLVAPVLLLTLFYIATGPSNHALSVDAYAYATMITTGDPWDVQQPRQLLWMAAMQCLYRATALFVSDPDPFRVIGVANAIQTALAIVVLVRILTHDFGIAKTSAWLSAALFGTSYGVWRYASEIEVYSTAILLSLLLVHLTFSLDRTGNRRGVLPLALLGGLGTLTYQPIGIVAAMVVPFFLLCRGRIRQLVLYGAVSGGIVVTGFGLAGLLGNGSPQTGLLAFLFDPRELNPTAPDRMAPLKALFSIGHDLLSTYWLFAFDQTQTLLTRLAPDRFFNEEIFVATQAGSLAWIPLVTLPCAILLLGAMAFTAARHRRQRRFSLPEATILVWFAAHGAMMLVMSPAGVEGWILGTVPLMLLVSLRLIGPCIAAGRTRIVQILLAVFLLHNGVSGLGMQMSESGNYLKVRGEEFLARTGQSDLIVIASDWSLYQYLLFTGDADIVQVPESTPQIARQAIDETLARGARVLMADTVAEPPPSLGFANPELARTLSALARDYVDGATRFDTGGIGWAYELPPSKADE